MESTKVYQMTKAQATFWVSALPKLLAGHKLVVCYTNEGMREGQPEVRVDQEFEDAYMVEHQDGTAVVAICDTYGVHAGFDTLGIDPDKYTIYGRAHNGYGERIWITFTLQKNPDNRETRQAWLAKQEQSWAAK
jgi:hypothetical protein